jgi:hypothetical protein
MVHGRAMDFPMEKSMEKSHGLVKDGEPGTSVFSGFRVGKYSTRLLESTVAMEKALEMDGIS